MKKKITTMCKVNLSAFGRAEPLRFVVRECRVKKYYRTYSIKMLSDGLFGMEHIRFGRQLWARVKMKKAHRCIITETIIQKGDEAYRPLTNAGNRYERISTTFFEANR